MVTVSIKKNQPTPFPSVSGRKVQAFYGRSEVTVRSGSKIERDCFRPVADGFPVQSRAADFPSKRYKVCDLKTDGDGGAKWCCSYQDRSPSGDGIYEGDRSLGSDGASYQDRRLPCPCRCRGVGLVLKGFHF